VRFCVIKCHLNICKYVGFGHGLKYRSKENPKSELIHGFARFIVTSHARDSSTLLQLSLMLMRAAFGFIPPASNVTVIVARDIVSTRAYSRVGQTKFQGDNLMTEEREKERVCV